MSTDSTRRCWVDCACALGAEARRALIPMIAPRKMSKGARPICISAIPSEVLATRLQGAEIKAKGKIARRRARLLELEAVGFHTRCGALPASCPAKSQIIQGKRVQSPK